MSFGLYMVGFVVALAGVAWGMSAAGVALQWVLIVSLVLLGIGILSAVRTQRTRDKSP